MSEETLVVTAKLGQMSISASTSSSSASGVDWSLDPSRGPIHKRVTDLPLGEGNRHVKQNLQCCPLLGTRTLTLQDAVHSWSFAVGGNNWVMMGVCDPNVDRSSSVFALGESGQAWMLFGGYSGAGMLIGTSPDTEAVGKVKGWPALAPGDIVTCILDLKEGTLAFQVAPRMSEPLVVFRGLAGKTLVPTVSSNNKNATLELLVPQRATSHSSQAQPSDVVGMDMKRYLPKKDDETLEEIKARMAVGDRCNLLRGDYRGEVKTIGVVSELDHNMGIIWVGVELDEPYGDCNGTPPNSKKSYFTCPKNHGMFLRVDELEVGDFPEEDPFASSDDDES